MKLLKELSAPQNIEAFSMDDLENDLEFSPNSANKEYPEELPDDSDPEESTDPNFAGLIRLVPNASLVYKQEAEDGTFEEMWFFNHQDRDTDSKTRRLILAGTDVSSEDSPASEESDETVPRQDYEIWVVGNATIIRIYGLPN